MAEKSAQVSGVKRVNLALQGGGSFGAFTWGALDRLLEDERIEIAAISGTSAGAMNAVALTEGMMRGGREGARACLRSFWNGIADASRSPFIGANALQNFLGTWGLDLAPMTHWMDMMTRAVSPYDFNPLNWNPLRDLIDELVDFDKVQKYEPIKVFISATNVHTGRVRVFQRHELTPDHVMASACLPYLFQAVVIDGVPYWDGGYMGNPSLWPLFEFSDTDDTILIQINPLERNSTPRSAQEIMDRVGEITFNASLLRELRAVDFVNRLRDDGRLEGTDYRRVLMLIIEDKDRIEFDQAAKMRLNEQSLRLLFDGGRASADEWLSENFDCIGHASTINLRKLFLGEADGLDGERIKRKTHKPAPSKASGADR